MNAYEWGATQRADRYVTERTNGWVPITWQDPPYASPHTLCEDLHRPSFREEFDAKCRVPFMGQIEIEAHRRMVFWLKAGDLDWDWWDERGGPLALRDDQESALKTANKAFDAKYGWWFKSWGMTRHQTDRTYAMERVARYAPVRYFEYDGTVYRCYRHVGENLIVIGVQAPMYFHESPLSDAILSPDGTVIGWGGSKSDSIRYSQLLGAKARQVQGG